jgi:hypothetical protein
VKIKNLGKITVASIVGALAFGALTACSDDSVIVDENMDRSANNFEIPRRVVFFNGITDKYLLTIEGMCSITDEGNQLEVICKTGPDEFKKQFLGLSDNVTYFVEQMDSVKADAYHYRVTFKPEQILPEFDLRTSNEG